MYYCALSLGVLQHILAPQISCHLCDLVFWSTVSGVFFGVCMIKLRHERMLILRCILPPQKNELSPDKKVTPPPPATT